MKKISLLRRHTVFRDARATVGVVRMRAQQPMGAHRHDFVEIVVVLSGSGIHATGQVRHEIRGGDVMVIHGKRSHAYEKTNSLHLVNILVSEHVLEDMAKRLGGIPGYHPLFTFEFVRWQQKEFRGHLHLNPADLQKVADWLEAIEKESGQPGDAGHCLAHAWLTVLIGLLARHYGKDAAVSPHLDIRLGRVLARMDGDPCRQFSLKEMAKEARMSERSFLRYFRKASGFSPTDYLIRGRIRRAETMLLEKGRGISITEVAYCCGFSDSNYFSRQFRRVVGKTPREYRG